VNSRAIIVIGFLIALGAIVFVTWRRTGVQPDRPAATAAPSAASVELTFLYSTEKKEWVEFATQAFQRDNPNIAVKLIGKGSIDAAQALIDGRDKPVLWSPADSLALNLAESDWETKNGSRLIAAEGTEDAPQALVITPLVFVIWEDRAEVLQKAGKGQIGWRTIHDAIASNQGWPAVGGKPDWGFVKLGHTDPTRSNSGVCALLSMTIEFYKQTSGLEVGQLLKPEYQAFVKQIEKGVTQFEASTGTFMQDMIRFGPSKFDIAWVYENLAIAQLENAQGRWGNLKVYYPATTIWSDHPAALLEGSWVTEAQRKAGRKYLAYLRGRPQQEQALRYGFRPADPSIPLKTADSQNPFTRLAQYGINVDIPPAAGTPSGPVVRNLITMWSRIVSNR